MAKKQPIREADNKQKADYSGRVRKKTTSKKKRGKKTIARPHGGQVFRGDIEEEVWRCAAIGKSIRQTAELIGCGSSVVSKVLQEDPERRVSIERMAREDRAKLWQRLENEPLNQALVWIELLGTAAMTDKGQPRKRLTDNHKFLMQVVPRVLSSLVGVADKATKQSQLLSGGVTEIMGHKVITEKDPTEWSDEEIVARAESLGVSYKLPPVLQEVRQRMIELGTLAGGGEDDTLDDEGSGGRKVVENKAGDRDPDSGAE